MEEGVSVCNLEDVSEFEFWDRMEEKMKVFTRRQRKQLSFPYSPLEMLAFPSEQSTRVP